MPNHVTNKLTVTGDEAQLAALQEKLDGGSYDGGEPRPVSFEGIIPVPETIDATPGLDGLANYVGRPGNSIFREKETVPFEDIPEDKIQGMIESEARVKEGNYPSQIQVPFATVEDVRAAYEMLVDNYRLHGHSTWYGWCPANWSTKWDAYSQVPVAVAEGERVFGFQTAWSAPFKVIVEASRLFPGLLFDLEWEDEGGPFGRERFLGGRSVARIEGYTEYSPEPEDFETDPEGYAAWENDPGTRVETVRTGKWED